MTPQPLDIGALRRAFTCLADRETGGPACPTAEHIWAAAGGELGVEETAELVDHVASCASCAEAWSLARSFREGELSRPKPAAVVRGPWYRRTAPWAAAAAAALILAVGGTLLVEHRPPPAPAYRAADDVTIRSLVAEDAPLPKDAFLLRWQGPEGSRYDLLVSTADLRVLAQPQGLSRPQYRVPEALLADQPAGAEILWQVEAERTDGTRVTSDTFISRVQ